MVPDKLSRRIQRDSQLRSTDSLVEITSRWAPSPKLSSSPGRARTRTMYLVSAIVSAIYLGALLVGCGSGGTHEVPVAKISTAAFDPHKFRASPIGSNIWFPLTPGLQWVRNGTTLIGHRAVPHRVISTVTNVSRLVDGVRTIVVLDQDIDAGQTVQQSLDYLAQDKQNNVWFVGGYTEEYEGGRFVTIRDAWLSGPTGGQPGILMPGDPRTRRTPWSIARPPGADSDAAEVVTRGTSQCVPYGCFKNVLVIREGKASALDNEFKYYAPGVGQILNKPRSKSVHKDVESLVNLTQLGPRGLAELSAEALALDKHARATKPSVFARSAPARSGR